MDCHSLRRRQLHLHAVFGQHHAVEARVRTFTGLVFLGGKILAGRVPWHALSGHQQHITHLRDARTADMRIREAQDARRTVLVAAAVVPTPVGVIGPGRHHAEGHHCRRCHMTCAVSTDERVDVAGEVGAGYSDIPRYHQPPEEQPAQPVHSPSVHGAGIPAVSVLPKKRSVSSKCCIQ